MSGRRYCLWGGREGWVQIGSPTDRRLQGFARLTADFERVMSALGNAVMPAIQQSADMFAAFGRALTEARTF